MLSNREKGESAMNTFAFIQLYGICYDPICRSCIELEKKGYAESYEQGQEMQKNLISVASEVEKLRAEVANAEKRSRAIVSAGNQGMIASVPNVCYLCDQLGDMTLSTKLPKF